MKFLNQYYATIDPQQVQISAEQGSTFAKKVAGDYNPIHNPDSKRFCVPGDLLFAIALERYGLNQKMSFDFLNLVSADSVLRYPSVDSSQDSHSIDVSCDRGKVVLGMQCSGERCLDAEKIEPILRSYVQFSGQNFPHIFVPLMQEKNVMINPVRPLVMYQSMSFELQTLDFENLEIQLSESTLTSAGKRGNVTLGFSFLDNGKLIGSGSKCLVLGGLREYDQVAIDQLCADYEASKCA